MRAPNFSQKVEMTRDDGHNFRLGRGGSGWPSFFARRTVQHPDPQLSFEGLLQMTWFSVADNPALRAKLDWRASEVSYKWHFNDSLPSLLDPILPFPSPTPAYEGAEKLAQFSTPPSSSRKLSDLDTLALWVSATLQCEHKVCFSRGCLIISYRTAVVVAASDGKYTLLTLTSLI